MTKTVFPILIICFVAAFILAAAYNITAPNIAVQEKKKEEEAVFSVIPADSFEKVSEGETVYYKVYQGEKLTGFALKMRGMGYGGTIELMVGIEPEGKLTGVRVLKQAETPGLGARIAEVKPGEKEAWWTRQFKGKQPRELNLKHIEAITGATISSKAVIDIVQKEVEKFCKITKM